MGNIALQIRGTFGSGKSTIVRDFIELNGGEPLHGNNKKKPIGYYVTPTDLDRPVYVVGSYVNVCGGLDSFGGSQQGQADRVIKALRFGHVLTEGVLVSSSGLSGAYCKTLHPTGQDVYAFLDTPLELCIERVKQRRLDKGNTKEFDPANLIDKYNSVNNCRQNLLNEGTYKVCVLKHDENLQAQVKAIFAEFA